MHGACTSFSASGEAGPDAGTVAEAGSGDTSLADSPFMTDAPGNDGAAADGAVDANTSRRRVFVTSTPFTASQLSAAAAVFVETDGLCAQAATKLANAGTFRAWITDGATSAAARNVFNPPYYDVTGSVIVFGETGAFSSAGLRSELNAQPPAAWWTGMRTQTDIGSNCLGWTTSAAGYGTTGSSISWFGGSEAAADRTCMGNFSGLLCLEQ
jgi:hypothetical protein